MQETSILRGSDVIPESSGKSVPQAVKEIWRDAFGVSDVDERNDFFEMGGDSLVAMLILFRIQETFGIELSPSSLFDAPAFPDFVAQVEGALGKA